MKTLKKLITITIITIISMTLSAQQGSPAPPGTPTDNTPVGSEGGGAPIGSGVWILLTLGAAYGGKKVYYLRKERLEE